MTHGQKFLRCLVSPPRALALGGLAVSAALFAPRPALAQALSGEVASQRFDPAPGVGNMLSTRALRMDGKLEWNAGLMVNYGYKPFVAESCVALPCDEPANLRSTSVVENQVTGDLLAALTIIPQLQVGLKIPVTWLNGQGIRADGSSPPEGLSAVGLGDIQIEAKGRFYGNPGDVITLGGYLWGGIPVGNLIDEGSYLGNATASLGASAVASGAYQDLTYAVNLGAVIRETAQLGGTSIGPEARWSVGAGYQIGPIVRVVADIFGGTAFSSDGGANNIEGLLAAQIKPMNIPVRFTVGGGTAFLKGIGTPLARVLVGALYSPEDRDRDKDGIPDDVDACPTDMEDRDGFEDADGCPDIDNDQDTIPDATDKCPNEPEDFDGFEDKDGCPEPDNDKDGIPDVSDRCPLEPETKNGFLDEDGCPDEKDSDNDGIVDSKDQCIDEPEDTDGFEDTDGCPDPDNDADGIPDEQDECIDAAEDGKGEGPETTDGCPIDTDGDGVGDEKDLCPGLYEDLQGEGEQQRDGCPLGKEPKKK